MIDIGANLTNESFSNDLEDVIYQAKLHDIKKIIVTGTDIQASQQAITLAKKHDNFLYATVGLHPHYASTWQSDFTQQYKTLCNEKKVVAIGETGLDFFRNLSTESEQVKALEAHLEIAYEINKPLFLHEREAHETFYDIFSENQALCERAIVHCFTGNQQALKRYLDLGMHIGITGWICDKKRGAELREIIHYAPLDRLMIETDAPYLIPDRDKVKHLLKHKHRNEPWTLNYTAEALAKAHNKDIDIVKEKTSENAIAFFKLG